MLKFMKGYRTYTGILLLVLGAVGLGSLAADPETAAIVDQVLTWVGTVVALYGRYDA